MRYCFLLVIALISTLTYSQNLKSGGKLKPEQAIQDIRHYTIAYDVDPVQQSISGTVDIDLILSEPTQILLFDFWNGTLELKKVMVNGKEYKFIHENDIIEIQSSSNFSGKIKASFTISGKPAIATRPPWTGGFQWSKDSTGNPWIAITCQGEGAKIYIPCKDHPSDEPNEGADMIITVPKGLVAAGPGLLIKTTTKKDKTTYHWKTNYTISNYCLVFNVGKYKVVTKEYTTIDGNKVPMVFYVLEEHADKAAHHLEVFERTTHVLEKYFGEYPFAKEKIGLCETPHLGMEHQTLIAYGNKFQYTKVGGEDFDWLLTHEFGHEWWANKVTNDDWAHMWIQEGICSFGDALYTRELAGEDAYLRRMAQTSRNINHSIPVVRGEVAVDSDSAYAAPIYGKGAFFMHTLRYILGDDIFFPTLKKLATDPKYTYDHMVNTRDVQNLFSDASGKDLKPLFDFYLYTTQKLEVRVRQMNEERYTVQLLNYDQPLPIDIKTDSGIQRTMIDKKGVQINSKTMLLVDPKVYYMKKVIYE